MNLPYSSLLCTLFLGFAGYTSVLIVAEKGCDSPQYLEIGIAGVITCSLKEDFLRIFWYNSTEIVPSNLILKLSKFGKSGSGLDSAEYDIHSNGSLIINKVSYAHDGNFTVVEFRSLEDAPTQYVVLVITTVKPSIRRPVIAGCSTTSGHCLSQAYSSSIVKCLVSHSRPPMSLQWVSRTLHGDMNLSSEVQVQDNGFTSTAVISTTNAFYYGTVLSLVVCKAHGLPGMLDDNESTILLENSNRTSVPTSIFQKFIEIGAKLELICSNSTTDMIVWKKSDNFHNQFHVIGYAVLFVKGFSGTYGDDYEVQKDGSLVVPSIEVKGEGLYGCVFQNGAVGDTALFNVTVYVPAYPSIDGCTQHQYCTMDAETEGSLTCSVTGIRPLVLLEVTTLHEEDSSLIAFTKSKVAKRNNGETYNIRKTLNYRIIHTQTKRLTLVCKVSGSNIQALNLTTTFDLNFANELGIFLGLPLGFAVLLIILMATLLLWYKKRGRRGKRTTTTSIQSERENTLMFPISAIEQPSPDKRSLFIEQMKGKYAELYNAINPIPHHKEFPVCVDKVFVDVGIEFLIESYRQLDWGVLHSYHSLINDPRLKPCRRFIQAEPGYGKTTLSLQLAYDWCNPTSNSPMRNVEICILLSLRQVVGVASIYQAIKQFILPLGSQLTETDIRSLLTNTSTTMIILDGYDEYRDRNDNTSFVKRIVDQEVLKKCSVIVTGTRSPVPKLLQNTMKTVRLNGLDENARMSYVEKVMTDNAVTGNRMNIYLGENASLQQFLHVPFYFVMYAHACLVSGSRPIDRCKSTANFINDAISICHNHVRNAYGRENNDSFNFLEKHHMVLGEFAFKNLKENHLRHVWDRSVLCETLGKTLYDYSVGIGILVEETFPRNQSSPRMCVSEQQTEVRFSHHLLCEWYAARFLCKTIIELGPKELEKLPLQNGDLEHLVLFACGLDPTVGKYIISHLADCIYWPDRDLAIRCILEFTGDFVNIHEPVRKLCSWTIRISNIETRLCTAAKVNILNLASRREITISGLLLDYSYSSVDLYSQNILLKAGHYIPVLANLEDLEITDRAKEIKDEELASIFKYSSQCKQLKNLRFTNILLPQCAPIEPLGALASRSIKVIWTPSLRSFGPTYLLNITTGKWMHAINGPLMSSEEYQIEVRCHKPRDV